ncbi:MAG: hypothetical protein BBJ57_10705 [Desulfobacterales bacterium PC51MH44]|jgi:hypothetical protein|nr:MAG: hypothetical protein BBJ57_10705 [Desulfobacterales bacterium PC51MH44]
MPDNVSSKEDILGNVNNAFTSLDQQRISGLEKIKTLQAIKNDSLEREKLRLSKKHGTFHPRVKKISERLAYNQGLKKELDNEIDNTKITIPDFDINTWMLHGRILNPEGNGLNGLTVSLYDENGSWIEKLGYACTDGRGYYAVRYRVEPEKKQEIPETRELFLTVTDSAFKVLHRETEPLFVKIGQIDFRLIVLEDKGGICEPPQPRNNQTAVVPPDAWLVRGRVVYENGEPGRRLTVSLYDKDLLFDDALGTILTDDAGRFSIIYRTDAFRRLFDAKPDLYLKVLDSTGNILFRSKKIRAEAGRVEEFEITIESGKSERSK